MRRKRVLFELALTALVLSGVLYWIHKEDLRLDVRLSLLARASHEDTWALHIDRGKNVKARVAAQPAFQAVAFELPKKRIDSLRLFPGYRKGTLVIEEISLQTLFKTYRWHGDRLKQIFGRKLGVERAYMEQNRFVLHVGAPKSLLVFAPDFRDTVNRLSANKVPYYFLAFVLAALLFYFVHFFSPGTLLIFCKPGVMTNAVLIFLILVFLPLADAILGLHLAKKIKLHPLQEKRLLSKKPDFRFASLGRLPALCQRYFDDNFPFRNMLIHTHNKIKVTWFGTSPLPAVLLGKSGWLFYARENERVDVTDYFRAVTPFTEKELKGWHTVLEERRRWLARRGIVYLFVVAPNKVTIYPEYMPDHIRPVGRRSRLDQLLAYLQREDPDFPILDLRAQLLAAKKERRVYRKTDSHWNDWGAYVAYREIIRRLSRFFPGLTPMPLSRFTVAERERSGGDLAILLYLQKRVFRGKKIWLLPKVPVQARGVARERIADQLVKDIKESPVGTLPTTLVVHDSFARILRPFLSDHFSRIVYINDWDMNFFPQVVKEEGIKIVIDQMAERFLMETPPQNPTEIL